MQFVFESRGAKKLARALEKFLASKGMKLAHGQALDALAIMQGFSDWNSLAASIQPEAINELLDAFELTHIDANRGVIYENEGELRTHTGFALRFPLHPEAWECDYVRTVDPLGREIAYWCDDEWRDAPGLVMGAIIGSLVRGNALVPSPKPARSQPQQPRVEGTINVYVGTYSSIEWGPAPQWAKIEITQEWLDEVLRLREIALTHDIDSVTQWGGPQWAEHNSDDEDAEPMRMDMGKLHVRSDRFWYEARPKHTDDDVETAGVDFEPLLKALANEQSSECYLRHGDDIVWGGGTALVDVLRDAGEALPQFPASEEPQEG